MGAVGRGMAMVCVTLGAGYVFLAILNTPVLVGSTVAVRCGLGAYILLCSVRGNQRQAAAIGLTFAAIVLVGVPVAATLHQDQQREDARARAAGYNSYIVSRGLLTQQQLDESNRQLAEFNAAMHEARRADCSGREVSCWVEDNEGVVVYGLVVAAAFGILIARVMRSSVGVPSAPPT